MMSEILVPTPLIRKLNSDGQNFKKLDASDWGYLRNFPLSKIPKMRKERDEKFQIRRFDFLITVHTYTMRAMVTIPVLKCLYIGLHLEMSRYLHLHPHSVTMVTHLFYKNRIRIFEPGDS